MTIKGPIPASQLGKALIHEHFLVDFIGADKVGFERWDKKKVVAKVMPYLTEAKKAGVKSIFECTPAFLGRDIELLLMIAKESGMQIITNTGYYGVQKNKFLPSWALSETAEQLSARWIRESESGIDGTQVKPGFIKIGVDAEGGLSEVHKKLARAAALTHLKTGLTIFSHTQRFQAVIEQAAILQSEGVKPDAFVWVHAQSEENMTYCVDAIKSGIWVSLDGIGWSDINFYADTLVFIKSYGLLNRVLISHDAGWYKPDEPNGEFKGYTVIFRELIPLLKEKGFTDDDIDQLLVRNPASAMGIKVRRR